MSFPQMVLRPLDSIGSTGPPPNGGHDSEGGNVILRQSIPLEGCDVGQTLLGLWQAKLTLLGLVLELQGYLASERSSICVCMSVIRSWCMSVWYLLM